MKKLRASFFTLCFALALMLGLSVVTVPTMAADAKLIVGDWEGTLDPGAQAKKRIVVHITAAQDGTLSGTIDYPDQETSGMLVTAITYKEPTLHFESSSSQSVYDAIMNKDGHLEANRSQSEPYPQACALEPRFFSSTCSRLAEHRYFKTSQETCQT